VGFYVIPAAFCHYSTFLTLVGGGTDRSDRRLLGLVGQVLLAIPLIHMYFSISRTGNAARRARADETGWAQGGRDDG
jgi:hypothetical protein